ncbi:MAG: hypothetical protein KA099_01005 [Alphaproteobacteria bacterium]|mgnify:CR=1 FL=1|nr:hypothetical protein [Alphaproteobacteria bacterium]MBP7758360.1 hypothetical protein [Alphaproteobacteria bacterium]MBP7762355.1 hypothetical protein [Alphaproteobacteria bacterium]MBP7903878.1 hypothetical protein [Alphaproteobacteria bacterium]
MLLGFGWAVIQASRKSYIKATFDQVFDLDEVMQSRDSSLHVECRAWLEVCEDPWLKWQFIEHLNNHSGLLQFCTSRNHRTSSIWDLTRFICEQSDGSYGVLYIWDDEDLGERAGQNYASSYRVWRILDGQLTEHNDSLFTPLVSPNAFGDDIRFHQEE